MEAVKCLMVLGFVPLALSMGVVSAQGAYGSMQEMSLMVLGGAVFVLTGVVPLRRFADHQHRVRTAFGAVLALTVIVIGGLVINGRQITRDAFDQAQARNAVAAWLGDDTNFEVVSVTVADGDVGVVLAGPGDPPSAERLLGDLDEVLRGEVTLDLQWIPRRRVTMSSADG